MLNKTNPSSVLNAALPPPPRKWPNNYSNISGTLPGQEEGDTGTQSRAPDAGGAPCQDHAGGVEEDHPQPEAAGYA